VETPDKIEVDARGIRDDYLSGLDEYRAALKRECGAADRGLRADGHERGFDVALLEYLHQRTRRFG